MNILAVLYCYPPLLVPATMCYLKLLAGLRETGFEVTVLTMDPDSFDARLKGMSDDTLVRLIPEGVKNRPVKCRESNILVRAIKRSGAGYRILYRMFEPKGKEWYASSLNYLVKADLSRYDLILSCSQPHINHLIGYHLKQRTKRPWIAYFSDPWTDNPYTKYASEKIRRYNASLEGKVMECADAVLFTSEEMASFVMEKYPEDYKRKCSDLPHSFVPGWYELTGEKALEDRDGKIRVLHTGHFYGPRTPLPFLEAIAGLSREIDLAKRLEVRFFGAMDRKYHEFIEQEGLGGIVQVGKTIPYLETLAAMKNSDYLLLIDAPLKEHVESVFLPSKLIDYIGSRKPVIGITPGRGASARVLRESGNLVCDIGAPGNIRSAMRKAADRSLDLRPDNSAIAKYHYAVVTKKLKGIIEGLL